MKKRKNKQLVREVNNLTCRIKGHYPHLYASLGGRYIRRVLRTIQATPETADVQTDLFEKAII